MGCIYSYYKEEETYYPRLYCKVNGKYCIYSKKCLKQERFIPIDNQNGEECYLYNMEKRKSIPKGSNYVRFIHKGYLFVDLDDNKTVKIKNTLDNVQDYVYIKQVGNEYEISLSPFPIVKEEKEEEKTVDKKKTYKNKKKRNTTYVEGED